MSAAKRHSKQDTKRRTRGGGRHGRLHVRERVFEEKTCHKVVDSFSLGASLEHGAAEEQMHLPDTKKARKLKRKRSEKKFAGGKKRNKKRVRGNRGEKTWDSRRKTWQSRR